MELRERNAGLRQQRRKTRQRLARLDENQLLLGLVAAEKLDQGGLLGTGTERGPARGEVAPGGIVWPPPRETLERGCRCGGRGPGGGEQVLQREAATPGRAGGCKPADGGGEAAFKDGPALPDDQRSRCESTRSNSGGLALYANSAAAASAVVGRHVHGGTSRVQGGYL